MKPIVFESMNKESKEFEQAKINVDTMFRQCGIGYDKKGNPVFNESALIEWFYNDLQKKDYTLYDTI